MALDLILNSNFVLEIFSRVLLLESSNLFFFIAKMMKFLQKEISLILLAFNDELGVNMIRWSVLQMKHAQQNCIYYHSSICERRIAFSWSCCRNLSQVFLIFSAILFQYLLDKLSRQLKASQLVPLLLLAHDSQKYYRTFLSKVMHLFIICQSGFIYLLINFILMLFTTSDL